MKVFVTVLENGSILVDNTPITSGKFCAGSQTVFERKVNKEDVIVTLIDNGFSVDNIDVEPYLSTIGSK